MQAIFDKLELPVRWKIHAIFHVSLLKQNTNKLLELEPKIDKGKDKKDKVEAIKNNIINANKFARDQLPGVYYHMS